MTRLSVRDLEALADCAHFVLAGDWEQDAHGDVTAAEIEAALQRVYAELTRRRDRRRARVAS